MQLGDRTARTLGPPPVGAEPRWPNFAAVSGVKFFGGDPDTSHLPSIRREKLAVRGGVYPERNKWCILVLQEMDFGSSAQALIAIQCLQDIRIPD
jgi:hypothetical protein